ncbi:hypothetical protein [Micromonospora sp. NPDC005305]|uniref:hypothetical protein n=1 Tax=Micromonospora sp. NPDC005305 TaxID=3156875 RepID=UPI0033B7A6A2
MVSDRLHRWQLKVRDTGTAIATGGGVAVSGVVLGDIITNVAPVPRSDYLSQVVPQIAPEELVGRDPELAALAAFCTAPDSQPDGAATVYQYWRAPAWAGKTSLLSWFVLHPPDRVQPVAFFVTARHADQNDRRAFTDVVLEQLAELLGEPLPPLLTDATRDAHLRGALNRAAAHCHEQGTRLVLVIDGLDEDRGVTAGPDGHSIAALLPARPPHGMRVVVSGRPSPPIPDDVPDDHPLRDPRVVRGLSQSAQARVVKQDARRELRRLRYGSAVEQDLLGLLTASGGGLSAADLAALTGLSEVDVGEQLAAVSSRTYLQRVGRWRPDTTMYILGHEELQQQAVRSLGPGRLADYRMRLHAWADRYRDQGWPLDTPDYLLRAYFRLLHDTGDLLRMLACATDTDRHNGMLNITGGDTAALAEVTAAAAQVLHADRPDFSAVGRLAVHYEALTRRNRYVPPDIPVAWVRLGRPDRAEALASSIMDPGVRATALIHVAAALATTGDTDRAEALAQAHPDLAQSSLGLDQEALAAVVHVLAQSGDLDRAEAVARSIARPDQRVAALIDATYAACRAGDPVRGQSLAAQAAAAIANPDSELDHQMRADWPETSSIALAAAFARAGAPDAAEAMARSLTDPDQQVDALVGIARAVSQAGDPSRGRALAAQAEAVARTIPTVAWQPYALASVAAAVAAAGDSGGARRLACSITNPGMRAKALVQVVKALAAAGDWRNAQAVAYSIDGAYRRAEALASVAGALAGAGELPRAEGLAWLITDPFQRARALVSVATALAATGDRDHGRAVAAQAEAVARTINAVDPQAEILAAIAEVQAFAGAPDRAVFLAHSLISAGWQMKALTAIAQALADAGNLDRGRAVAAQAETVARSVTDTDWQARMLRAAVDALITIGDLNRAESAARLITETVWQASALSTVSEAMMLAGELARAETVAGSIADPAFQVRALAELVPALVGLGEPERGHAVATRAEAAARSISDPEERVEALARVASAFVKVGQGDHGHALAAEAAAGARTVDLVWREAAVSRAAIDLAGAGYADVADALAASLTEPSQAAPALRAVAEALSIGGNADRSQAAARQADAMDRRVLDGGQPAQSLAELARTLAEKGDVNAAVAVTHTSTDPEQRAWALTMVSAVLAARGNLDRSRILAEQAEAAADAIIAANVRARVLLVLSTVVGPPDATRLCAEALWLDCAEVLPTVAEDHPAAGAAIIDALLREFRAEPPGHW